MYPPMSHGRWTFLLDPLISALGSRERGVSLCAAGALAHLANNDKSAVAAMVERKILNKLMLQLHVAESASRHQKCLLCLLCPLLARGGEPDRASIRLSKGLLDLVVGVIHQLASVGWPQLTLRAYRISITPRAVAGARLGYK